MSNKVKCAYAKCPMPSLCEMDGQCIRAALEKDHLIVDEDGNITPMESLDDPMVDRLMRKLADK